MPDGLDTRVSRRPPVSVGEGRPMARHELHEHRILEHLRNGDPVTQRSLSRELGIALGLTNLLIRRLVAKGWVRISRVKRSRLRYLVTPAGIAAKAHLTRAYIRDSVRFYRETRDRIRQDFSALSTALDDAGAPPTIVFYGASEVTEIAYVCLQDTRLQLVALIDASHPGPFFNAPAFRPADLDGNTVAGRPFARIVVMPIQDEEEIRATLRRQRVPEEAIFWL